jgi:histidinol-phosphate/aromatic aminotransferase/cobyric acid decarboxylase-like protein
MTIMAPNCGTAVILAPGFGDMSRAAPAMGLDVVRMPSDPDTAALIGRR